MKPLTPKQQAVLDFLVAHIQGKGFPPTRAEISEQFEFRSQNSAEEHLRRLEEKGWISMSPGVSRGIKVL